MIDKILVFFFGSIVGSFLNVCIYRMPLGKSIVWPGSHCPGCDKKIHWYDNIPFVSYVFLRGKCRFCGGSISLRYPLVELLTALTFLVFFKSFGLSYEFFFYSVFVCGLIVATFVDIRHRIIPDEISIGGIILGFILSSTKGFHLPPSIVYHPSSILDRLSPMRDSFLGIIIGGGIIYLIGFIFDLVYFKLLKKPPVQGETSSMGGGDVKLLAMIGAFLGWKAALITFFLAPFLGISVGLVNLLVRKEHIIPYGPFLSLAAVLSIFFSHRIISLFIPL